MTLKAAFESHLSSFLIFRSEGQICATPVEEAIESFRPLPIVPLKGYPHFVLGVSIVRGVPVPVLHGSLLLAHEASAPGRFIAMRNSNGVYILAVDEVLGVFPLETDSTQELRSFLHNTAANTILALRLLDGRLLAMLELTRVLSEYEWQRLHSDAGVPP